MITLSKPSSQSIGFGLSSGSGGDDPFAEVEQQYGVVPNGDKPIVGNKVTTGVNSIGMNLGNFGNTTQTSSNNTSKSSDPFDDLL